MHICYYRICCVTSQALETVNVKVYMIYTDMYITKVYMYKGIGYKKHIQALVRYVASQHERTDNGFTADDVCRINH